MPETRNIGRHPSAPPRYCREKIRHIRKQSPRPSIRRSVRLQERLDCCTKRILADIGTKRINSLPSPSASETHSKEAGSPTLWAPIPSQGDEFGEVEQLRRGAEYYTTGELSRKRKCAHEAEDSKSRVADRPTQKRTRISQLDGVATDTESRKGLEDENCHPIECWAKTGSWPESFFKDQIMSRQSSKKRSRSTSYTQSIKDGDNPRAYTPKYEEVLAKAGIFMDAYHGQATISDSCQKLCNDLLSDEYEHPEHSLFQDDFFWTVLRRVRSRNEPRVFRDITPSIVPSAELFFIRGNHDLEHLTEELDAVWTKCSTLAGPQPKPDLAIGLMSSAFTDEEILKLKSYTAPDRATLFTENMYFPFLLCETKCGDQAINRADRQNAHSASIAVNAIIQLYRAVPPSDEPHTGNRASLRVMELDKKILTFSISHDHSMVKIYGHYASIQGDKTIFYRHPVRSFDFTELNGKGRWIAYNFTRKVYNTFAPMHMERIRNAIVQLADPSSESLTSGVSVDTDTEGPDSQDLITTVPYQEIRGFKVPSLPPSVRVQKENDRLRDQVDMLLLQQQEQQRQQQEQQQQQQKQQRQQQEQVSKLQGLLVEQQEQNKEQIEQQRQQHKEQMEQYKEMIRMLQEQKSAKG